jgi:hypothetical protein
MQPTRNYRWLGKVGRLSDRWPTSVSLATARSPLGHAVAALAGRTNSQSVEREAASHLVASGPSGPVPRGEVIRSRLTLEQVAPAWKSLRLGNERPRRQVGQERQDLRDLVPYWKSALRMTSCRGTGVPARSDKLARPLCSCRTCVTPGQVSADGRAPLNTAIRRSSPPGQAARAPTRRRKRACFRK